MKGYLSIGIAQTRSLTGDIRYNLSKAKEQIYTAARRGAEVVCFPELFPSGYGLDELGLEIIGLYQNHYQLVKETISEAARYSQVYVVFPTGIPKQSNKLENGLICFDPSGKFLGTHSKFHLWAREKEYFLPGDVALFINIDSVRIGFAICYDLGFPEVSRYLRQYADVIIAPSAWDISGFRLWEMNLSQRAAENTLFTVGVNAVGHYDNVHLFGRSMVCGPTGEIIHELPCDKESLGFVKIDMSMIEEARKILPYLKDRRIDLFSKWFPFS